MIIKRGNKKIDIKVKKLGFFGKISGLMFRTYHAKNLLFEFRNDGKRKIHSFFVFFHFLAIWLDKDNNVVDYLLIRPWKFSIVPQKSFRKLVEVPINMNSIEISDFLVGKGKGLNTRVIKKY
ncbi:MAG: hypothetical protein WCK90_03800 [archaeon]